MSNHLSFLDGPLLYSVIPQPIRVILKKEIFKIPIIGLGMKQVEFVPVDRKSIRGGKKSIDHAVRLMKEKVFIFDFSRGNAEPHWQTPRISARGFFSCTGQPICDRPDIYSRYLRTHAQRQLFCEEGDDQGFFPSVSFCSGKSPRRSFCTFEKGKRCNSIWAGRG